MLIKHKLMTNALIAVCSLGIMYLLFIFTLETVKELNKGKVLALQMETDMLQLRTEALDIGPVGVVIKYLVGSQS